MVIRSHKYSIQGDSSGGIGYLSAATFLVLYPVFSLYHYLLAQTVIPPFLGSLFGVSSVIAAAVYLGFLPAIISKPQRPRYLLIVVLVIAAYAFWSLLMYARISKEAYAYPALYETGATLSQWFAAVFMGCYFPFRNSLVHKVLRVAAIALVGMALHSAQVHGAATGLYQTFSQSTADSTEMTSARVTYQGIARSAMITGIILAAVERTAWRRVVVLLFSAAICICSQARTELIVTCLVLMLPLATLSMSGKHRLGSIALFIGILFVGFQFEEMFKNERTSEILRLGESASWQSRIDLSTGAVAVIASSPFLGEFGQHHKAIGAGGYAHNALSAWVQFGLLGFTVYIGLTIGSFILSCKHGFSDGSSNIWRAAFYMNCASMILIFTALPVFSPLPAIGWGLCLGALWDERTNRTLLAGYNAC